MSKIIWHYDKDNDVPMAPISTVQPGELNALHFGTIAPSCHHILNLLLVRVKQQQNTAQMQEILEAKQETNNDTPHSSRPWPHQKKAPGKHKQTMLSDP